MDVRTAYQQYRLSLSKAKLVCTRLFSRRRIKGTDQEVAVIMIALTGTFGDVGAGDTYAILGDVFHELHNAVWALWRSVTYVDDMLILAPPFSRSLTLFSFNIRFMFVTVCLEDAQMELPTS